MAGDLPTLAQRLPVYAREARRRGDGHGLALLSFPSVVLALARDQPDVARSILEAAVQPLEGRESFHLRDFMVLHGQLLTDRYEGAGDATWQRLDAVWKRVEGSSLLYANVLRVTALAERGSAAADAAVAGDERCWQVARQCARALHRERLPHTRGLAALLEARIADAEGDRSGVLAQLGTAAAEFQKAGMALHALCVRWTLGVLSGGELGSAMVVQAERGLRERGVRDCARFARVMVPGVGES